MRRNRVGDPGRSVLRKGGVRETRPGLQRLRAARRGGFVPFARDVRVTPRADFRFACFERAPWARRDARGLAAAAARCADGLARLLGPEAPTGVLDFA